jgi:hypothetical protein
MSPAAEARQARRCLPPSLVTGRWTGVAKALVLLRDVRAASAADDARRIRWAVSDALESCAEDPNERHALVSVLSDVLALAVQFIDIETLCQQHEVNGVSEARCLLRLQRAQAAAKSASAAHARAAKAAKRAARTEEESSGRPVA